MFMVLSWNVSIWETTSPSPFVSSKLARYQLLSESHFMNLSPKP